MWLLFAILIQSDGYAVYPQGPFATMDQCFEAREYFMATEQLKEYEDALKQMMIWQGRAGLWTDWLDYQLSLIHI